MGGSIPDDLDAVYSGSDPSTMVTAVSGPGAAVIVGSTVGKVTTWEQLGDWSIIDAINSVGIYLDEGSFVKLKRAICHLPPVDPATGWLSPNYFFGHNSKVQKFIFGDGPDDSDATEASNSPGYIGEYEDWEAWAAAEDGYTAKKTTGYYQYLDFYD